MKFISEGKKNIKNTPHNAYNIIHIANLNAIIHSLRGLIFFSLLYTKNIPFWISQFLLSVLIINILKYL